MQFSKLERNQTIESIRFQNLNQTQIYLDDCELFYSYSDKPPGLSLLALPIFWFGEFFTVGVLGVDPDISLMVDNVIKFLIMVCVLAFGAFTVVKFYDFLRFEGISHTVANWIALIFGLGSLYYVYIGTFFSHSITASLLFLSLYFGNKFRRERELTSLLWAGILSGFAVVGDYIVLFLLPLFYLYLFLPIPWHPTKLKKYWKKLIGFYFSSTIIYLFPVILCGLLVTYYNFIAFGDPFVTPYSYARFFKDVQHFAGSMMDGLEILLTSRHHGLFTFMPILLIAFLGFLPMFRKNPGLAAICF
jgi:hypothetical protein